ncbi:leucine-rich repeat protein [Palleniella muris]|uniref:leucine-rich repeat protein n=1 Tax=Palleniella muris TaxID=3038145 RepID=UPI0024102D28|nr:leucine-rich repeat protein [Palleniella muris]
MELPNSIVSINPYTFRDCKKLSSIILPKSITFIGKEAFDNCANNAYVTVNVSNPSKITLGTSVFKNVSTNNCSLYVPFGSKELYATAEQWKAFGNIVEMPESTEPDMSDQPTEKCATPVITLHGNELVVTCATENARIRTTITSDDMTKVTHQSGEVFSLAGLYLVTSYAKASGKEQSELATAVLVWSKAADMETGVDAIDMNTDRALLIRSVGENIEIAGTSADETISLYNISGQQLYMGKSTTNATTIPVALTHGEVYIIKVGEQSIKYKF